MRFTDPLGLAYLEDILADPHAPSNVKMGYIAQRQLLTDLKYDIAFSLQFHDDDDLYYGEMSPFGDGIGHGISIRPDMMDQDYWYPKEEHKNLYSQGRALSAIVNGLVAITASVAGQAGGANGNAISKPQANYSDVYRTAYSTNNNNLDWSIKSQFGETRIQHVNQHMVNNLQKPNHGIFYGNATNTISKAWASKGNVNAISSGGAAIYNIPYANAGYAGGYAGQGRTLNYVTIVVKTGTNQIITGYPSAGR